MFDRGLNLFVKDTDLTKQIALEKYDTSFYFFYIVLFHSRTILTSSFSLSKVERSNMWDVNVLLNCTVT